MELKLCHDTTMKWKIKTLSTWLETGYKCGIVKMINMFSVFSWWIIVCLILKASRISNLHALANIEQWAVDLSWDIVARFCHVNVDGHPLPKEFFDDFVKVACDEAKVCCTI